MARAGELQSNLRKAHDDIRLLFGATGRSSASLDCNQALDVLRENLEEVIREADKDHRMFMQPLTEDDIAFKIPAREVKSRK